jgi:hypothetical protein
VRTYVRAYDYRGGDRCLSSHCLLRFKGEQKLDRIRKHRILVTNRVRQLSCDEVLQEGLIPLRPRRPKPVLTQMGDECRVVETETSTEEVDAGAECVANSQRTREGTPKCAKLMGATMPEWGR